MAWDETEKSVTINNKISMTNDFFDTLRHKIIAYVRSPIESNMVNAEKTGHHYLDTISRTGCLCCLSLADCIVPRWEIQKLEEHTLTTVFDCIKGLACDSRRHVQDLASDVIDRFLFEICLQEG